ncbi:MAG: hypothetical protein HOI53_09800 [Francisellaceae bacterium]|jgi:Sec-independent protein translocase protein TatA|nr:hypothetical protein [Francisellaceae bacterium]MBT6208307.1 hypothetical protein [Francisellaceae bacterium]MBT6538727.1 hypothetical protein [Francisellaceae bacterium]
MFGVGLWEIFLIIIVAIVVVPPKKWPFVAEQAGVFWVNLKNVITAFKNELR